MYSTRGSGLPLAILTTSNWLSSRLKISRISSGWNPLNSTGTRPQRKLISMPPCTILSTVTSTSKDRSAAITRTISPSIKAFGPDA